MISIIEAKSNLDYVHIEDVEYNGKFFHLKTTKEPFTGLAESYFENSKHAMCVSYKNGLSVKSLLWYPNGQKHAEINYKKDELMD